MNKLLSAMRKAITDYKMISAGDKIAVGVSGGKDSLTLLATLAAYKKFSPEPFELYGISVDMGFGNLDAEFAKIEEWCKDIDVVFHREYTNIYNVLVDRKETNPCSLCSKMRRGTLINSAIKFGCNKIALGHHSEDVLETFLLSFIYEGRLSTFGPTTYMDRTDTTVIRPFIYIDEGDIRGYAARSELPILVNPCPHDHHTQREYMKNLVKKIKKDIPFAADRMKSAVMHPERYNLFPTKNDLD